MNCLLLNAWNTRKADRHFTTNIGSGHQMCQTKSRLQVISIRSWSFCAAIPLAIYRFQIRRQSNTFLKGVTKRFSMTV